MDKSAEDPSSQSSDASVTRGANLASDLMPAGFDDFIGQVAIVTSLRSLVAYGEALGTTLDHMLLIGQPGSGRRTLAQVVASELAVNIKSVRARAVERVGDLAVIFTNLRTGDILLMEDMHLLNRSCADVLGPAMADPTLDVVIGKGRAARSIRLKLPRFTIVGTTHLPDLIPFAIARAYPLVFRFQEYSTLEMEMIIQKLARRLDLVLDSGSGQAIAALAKGVPRHALWLLQHWSQLSDPRTSDLPREQVLELLAQRAQDYEAVITTQAQEREMAEVQVDKSLRQLESDVNERLDHLESRIDELRDELAKNEESWLD